MQAIIAAYSTFAGIGIKSFLMRIILFCLAIIAGLSACKKEQLDLKLFWECNQSQHLDSLAISGKLVGSWKWSKQSCFWTGQTTSADKNLQVTFKNDKSFSISENAGILSQGIWKIVKLDVSSWGLDLSSPSEYLYGRILFCSNQVLFNDSYRDGCDNLFDRIN
jgi:hypothetical protein